jgi:holo-[acyl-carrier protein] synthase
MIRVGIDLENIKRFDLIQKGRKRAFYQRVYTPAERSAYGTDPVALALCFTAKEAVAKALGTGLTLGIPHCVSPIDIETLCSRRENQPRVSLWGKAQEVAWELHLSEIILYWHHNGRLAFSIAGGADTALTVVELHGALKKSLEDVIAYMDRMDDDRKDVGKRF